MAKPQRVETPNFGSILDQQSSEIERPKPLPVGTYTCIVKGLPRFDKSSKKGTDFVEFTLQPVEAGEDVDEEDLDAVGGLANKTLRHTLYITEDAAYRIKDFCDHLGIEEDDMSLRQRIEQAPGKQVLVTVKHTASDDGSTIYANVGRTASVE